MSVHMKEKEIEGGDREWEEEVEIWESETKRGRKGVKERWTDRCRDRGTEREGERDKDREGDNDTERERQTITHRGSYL